MLILRGGRIGSELDVTRFYREHREIADLIAHTKLRIARRIRVVVEEKGGADHVRAFARFAVVLHAEIDGVNQIRIVRAPRRAAEKSDVAVNFHTGNINLQHIALPVFAGESRIVQNGVSLHCAVRVAPRAERKLSPSASAVGRLYDYRTRTVRRVGYRYRRCFVAVNRADNSKNQ